MSRPTGGRDVLYMAKMRWTTGVIRGKINKAKCTKHWLETQLPNDIYSMEESIQKVPVTCGVPRTITNISQDNDNG